MVRDRAWGIWGELSCDVTSTKNVWAVPVRSSIFHDCSSDFAAQVFRWDFTVNRCLFLVTMSSASLGSEMKNVDSEESVIYYIAEDMK